MKGIVAGLPGHLVPVHPTAGPAPHAGQQRSQPSHLPLRQAGKPVPPTKQTGFDTHEREWWK